MKAYIVETVVWVALRPVSLFRHVGSFELVQAEHDRRTFDDVDLRLSHPYESRVVPIETNYAYFNQDEFVYPLPENLLECFVEYKLGRIETLP